MTFSHDFMHYDIFSTSVALIPYSFSISKGVGGILEESQTRSLDSDLFKERVGVPSLYSGTSWCLDFLIECIVIDLEIF